MTSLQHISRSMLWAAYGDALGFITELAGSSLVRQRIRTSRVEHLVPWKRRIGGRFGVNVEMPQGCYSDDTQLRLATCRSIASEGRFDVESFAKVELTVWRSYALGAGLSTKAAAKCLTRADVQWYGNFFEDNRLQYINGGGNGAAMRIQPHVWAAGSGQRDSEILKAILRNAIATHGHPRGFIGAAFHGMCVSFAMRENRAPTIRDWHHISDNLRYVPKLLRNDEEIGTFWVSLWERRSNTTIEAGVEETIQEVRKDIEAISQINLTSADDSYTSAVSQLGCLQPENRGSGTKTAILASYLALLFADEPAAGLICAANVLGSDTDTICTMAGAILGSVARCDPPEEVADQKYLLIEAKRMHDAGQGRRLSGFPYPDLLTWKAPRAEIDYVGRKGKDWYLAGFGQLKIAGPPYEQVGNYPAIWQWFELEFGQRLLLKRRAEPSAIHQSSLPFNDHESNDDKWRLSNYISIDDACRRVIQSGFQPKTVGEMILKVAEGKNGIKRSAELATAIAKAKSKQER